jgi:hemolysin activation/secretion protein
VQRVQRLSDDHLLIVQADLQLTPDSLLPSQQFIIGGGHSVRGYRQNARSGDNGFRFSMEDRIALDRDEGGIPVFQLAPFLDIGAVWNFADNPNELPDQTFLISTGLGLIWDSFGGIKGLSLRLDYGIPFIDLDDRGRNIQDQGFYFSLIYQP